MVISGSVDGFARFHSRPMTGLAMRYEFPHSDSLLLVCHFLLIDTPYLILVSPQLFSSSVNLLSKKITYRTL